VEEVRADEPEFARHLRIEERDNGDSDRECVVA
jgi:hypothetical protein